jgi:two-component system phosphate regulon sensor histidine kinase PhoR
MGLRTVFTLLAILVSALFFGSFFSETLSFLWGVSLLVLFILYQSWNQERLLKAIQGDDLIGRSRGIGRWRIIFELLEKKSKGWRQEILRSEIEYKRFIQAVQASPNGLIMLDEDDQIEWCNNICKEHFRLDPLRDARQPITFLLRHPDFIRYMQNSDFTSPLNLDFMGVNGNLMLLLQVYPYGENRKLLLSQDVTVLKRNESIRQDFVANVSHELRTPLTVLNGFLETLQEIPLNAAERKKYLNLMSLQSSRMLSLVEELLILTKLDHSPISPKTSVVKVKDLLQRLLDDGKSLSNSRHEIRCEIHSEKNILGAENEIFSAFSNLVTNAIRYTQENGFIEIAWRDEVSGGAIFSVTDSGIGITPEHIPRLTERFYRVDRSRSRESGGTGLGLAIVKHVAIRHGAKLEIQSTPAVGSVFSIQFDSERLTPDLDSLKNEASQD